MKTYPIIAYFLISIITCNALEYNVPRFYSSAIKVDSVVIRCSIKLPPGNEPTFSGIIVTRVSSYTNGRKDTYHWPSKRVFNIISPEAFIEYVPVVYHSFIEYSERSNLKKGVSYSVPFTVYRSSAIIQHKAIWQRRTKSKEITQLTKLSSSLASNRDYGKLYFNKAMMKRLSELRNYAIETIPEEEVCKSDSLMFIELVGKDNSVKSEHIYVQCSSDADGLWDFSMETDNQHISYGKSDFKSNTGVGKLINYVRCNAIDSLTTPFGISEEIDTHYYIVLLMCRVNKKYLPVLYLNTNKSEWFGIE